MECKWFNPEIFLCCVIKGELRECNEQMVCLKFEPTQKCASCRASLLKEIKEGLESFCNGCQYGDTCLGNTPDVFTVCYKWTEFWDKKLKGES